MCVAFIVAFIVDKFLDDMLIGKKFKQDTFDIFNCEILDIIQ